jgi:hypothetical protein
MLVPSLGKEGKKEMLRGVLTAIVELFFLLFCSGESHIIIRA